MSGTNARLIEDARLRVDPHRVMSHVEEMAFALGYEAAVSATLPSIDGTQCQWCDRPAAGARLTYHDEFLPSCLAAGHGRAIGEAR